MSKEGFGTKQVCKIAQISLRQLRYWTRIGLLKATASGGRKGREEYRYNVRDILTVLVIRDLKDKGLSLQRIRQSVTRARVLWGKEYPLAQLRVACIAQALVFKKDRAYIEAVTGQHVIEAALDKIRSHVEPKRCSQTKRMVARQTELFLQKVSEM
ncbi:MAG: MerR family transcriptional regulator [Pseudomonadota bacterium]